MFKFMSQQLFGLPALCCVKVRPVTSLWSSTWYLCYPGKPGFSIISCFIETHANSSLGVWQHAQKKSERGIFPSPILVWTMWRQAGRHAMVADLAHPDCGLLSQLFYSWANKADTGTKGNMEWEEGLLSTAVTLSHIICKSGGKESVMDQRQRQGGHSFDDLQLQFLYYVICMIEKWANFFYWLIDPGHMFCNSAYTAKKHLLPTQSFPFC